MGSFIWMMTVVGIPWRGDRLPVGEEELVGGVRTSLVLRAVRSGIAADQKDFTARELWLAAWLHACVGELLSAMQYMELAEEKEVSNADQEHET